MFNKIYFIINPASGKSEPILNTIYNILHEKNINWDAGILRNDNISHLLNRAQQFNAEIIAVYGGDGTVSASAKEISKRNLPLAVIPGGTANALAMELDIPSQLEDDCKMLLTEEPKFKNIDLGIINDKAFLSQVSIGFMNKVIQETSQESKSRFGSMAYITKGLKHLFSHEIIELSIEIDGRQILTDAFSCMVCNSSQLGSKPIKLSPVDNTDGLLDVFLITDFNLKSLNAVVRDMVSSVQKDPLIHYRGKNIRLRCTPHQAVQYDGEILDADSYNIQVQKQAIKILIPNEYQQKT